MTTYWKRRLHEGGNAETGPGLGTGDSTRPAGSVAVGRYLGTVIVTIHGDLDHSASGGLAWVLRDLIDGQGNLAVVVDLRDVCQIDGPGVEILGSAAARIAVRGGELRLGGPTGDVGDSLALAGLARLISIPFEQAYRPWLLGRQRASALRQATINAHPAGLDRYHRGPA